MWERGEAVSRLTRFSLRPLLAGQRFARKLRDHLAGRLLLSPRPVPDGKQDIVIDP
jgi:hypothetical protein